MTAVATQRAGTGTPPARERRNEVLRYLPLMAVLTDVIVINLTSSLALLSRDRFTPFGTSTAVAEWVGYIAPALVVGWILCIAALGGYDRQVFGAGSEEYRKVVNASFLGAGAVGVLSYLAKAELSRSFYLLVFAVGIPALVLGRFALRRALQVARRRGHLVQRVVLAGNLTHIDEVDSVFRRERWLGYETVAAVTPATDLAFETSAGVRVAGNVDDASFVARQCDADVIVFAGGAFRSSREMRQAVWALEQEDVQVIVTPSVTDISSERVAMRPVAGLPMIMVERPRTMKASRSAKRVFDVVGASLLLLLLSPVFAFAAVRVWQHDRGPILFRQLRVGRDGAEFCCLKFRTMVVDAEALLARLHAEQGYDAGLFKMKDDPRITAPGQWLRRFSLDELPQLWNVLRGDMSLVGPRPPLPSEVATYEDAVARRLRVRPGMTGLWQVSGRSDLTWDEAVRLDLYYVDNWSMVQDLTILGRTVGAVLGSRGAY